jgi:hypothetical protein
VLVDKQDKDGEGRVEKIIDDLDPHLGKSRGKLPGAPM